MGLTEYTVDVKVEYKGVVLEGTAVYTRKDYCGITMTAPFNGVKTNDYGHLMYMIPKEYSQEDIVPRAQESLRLAYDECLQIKQRDGKNLAFMVLNSENTIDYSNKDVANVLKAKRILKSKYHDGVLSQWEYQTIVKELNQKVYNISDNAYKSLDTSYCMEYGKTIIANLNYTIKLLLDPENMAMLQRLTEARKYGSNSEKSKGGHCENK